jgi:hypothetical protein
VDDVAHHQVEDFEGLVGGELRHHCGERDQGGQALVSSQVGEGLGGDLRAATGAARVLVVMEATLSGRT